LIERRRNSRLLVFEYIFPDILRCLMDPRIAIVANGFYVAAAVLGVPSFLGSLFFGFSALRLSLLRTPATDSTAMPKNPDAVVLTVMSIAKVVGGAANLLGKLGGGLIKGLAIVSVSVLACAALLFLTGRGLQLQESWARWLAFLLMLPFALISPIGLLSRGSPLIRVVSAAVCFSSGYALFVLWTAFGEPV